MVATSDCTVLMKDACEVVLDAALKVRAKTTDAAYVELDPDGSEPVPG
jgi:hypothetical protein